MKKILIIASLLVLSVSCGKQVDTRTSTVNISVDKVPNTMTCKLYDMTGMNLGALPDFSTLQSFATIYPTSLNNPVNNNLAPFNTFVGTGHDSLVEQFAMVCEGKLTLKTSGQYSFYLDSDDGSRLYVNGFLLINDDGNHAHVKKQADATLLNGEVNIRIEYFNGFGDKALVFSMKEPNITFEELVKF